MASSAALAQPRGGATTTVWLLEPYLTGSHQRWAEGYAAHSALDVRLLGMPGRFWKWRMHGAAVSLARRAREHALPPDVVLASDMLDLAGLLGLTRGLLGRTPVALYMHENQLAYPAPEPQADWTASRRHRALRRDEHYPFVNLTSALAADVVVWNSAFNRDSFLARLPVFLRRFPDAREVGVARLVAERSRVLPVGLDLRALDAARPAQRSPGPPRVVWNHRWEHDKGPETFFRALDVLRERGVDFEVLVLGEVFARTPPLFAAARERLGPRVRAFGFEPDRDAYARWLWAGDVVVSTARHEFFGGAVIEAIHCGCRPVLPHALAYPELIPAAHHQAVLYESFDGLVERLQRAIASPDERLGDDLRRAVADLDWSVVAPRYDELLSELASRGPRDRRRGSSQGLAA